MDGPPRQNPAYRPSPSNWEIKVNKSRLLWTVLLFLYAGAIFALSSLPITREEPLVPILHGDKLLHGLEFFLFFLLCWKVLPRHKILFSLVLTGVYAGSDEFHQLFVSTRSASFFDWLADLGGGVAAAFLIYLLVHLPLSKRFRAHILVRSDPEKEA